MTPNVVFRPLYGDPRDPAGAAWAQRPATSTGGSSIVTTGLRRLQPAGRADLGWMGAHCCRRPGLLRDQPYPHRSGTRAVSGDLWVMSLHQPWASLYLHGRKNPENRGWPPPRTLSRRVICEACRQPLERDPAGGWARHTHGVTISRSIDVGPASFLLGIHATKIYDHAALEQRLVVEEILHLPEPPGNLTGMLLGFVTITPGTHHASECACDCGGRRWVNGVPCELCNAAGTTPPALRPHDACTPWGQTGDVWHWVRSERRLPLAAPIPMPGRQRLWRMPDAHRTLLPPHLVEAA